MNKPIQRTMVAFAAVALVTSCASVQDSLLIGGAVGATAGGLVGNHATEHDSKGTAIGAATGAAFGALFGYLGYKDARRKERDQEAKLNALKGKPKYPSVSAPEVRAIWVPDKIENDQFVSGHYLYQIDKPAAFKQE